ncbi:MAG: hypothetical protein ACRYGG_05075 [Janthinobacterium lividum]
MIEPYIPHMDLWGSAIISLFGVVVLVVFHRSRDRMMEYKFLTREDFRRVESKIDALLNVAMQAPFISEHQKGAIRPKKFHHEKD